MSVKIYFAKALTAVISGILMFITKIWGVAQLGER